MTHTQTDTVLEFLQTHGSMTSMQAIMGYSITRLAEHIRRLRVAGWDIETERVSGNRGWYARYHLRRAA